MTRFLCTGDLHLGKGTQYADDRLGEQEAVLAEIVRLTDEHEVDALLIAGDIFEGPIPTPEHYRAFTRPLTTMPVPIIAVSGNGRHDSAMRDACALDVVNDLLRVSRRPELLELRDCTVATLPWTPITRKVAAAAGGDRDDVNAEAALQLVSVARGLLERARKRHPMRPVVLLGHWTLSGWSTPTGMDTSLLRDVVIPTEELDALGFDACVFGHIHRGGLVAPRTLYVGSPLPLDFGEGGCEHGCWLVEIRGDRPPVNGQAVVVFEFLPIESRPFKTLEFEEGAAERIAGAGAFDWLGDVDEAIVKVRYTATSEQARRIDNNALRQALLDSGAHRVYIEPTIVREQRARVEGLDESIGDEQALAMWLDAHDVNGDLGARLRDRHATYSETLA